MKAYNRHKAALIRAGSAVLMCSIAAVANAQSGYRIGEDSATADSGPVRMARFDYLKGRVDFRPSTELGWSSATPNLPIRQGAQVWATAGSRSEVQFDDGSDMRLADGAIATLATLYSDSHGEFTEIKLTNGLATFHLTNKQSLYQIDTPTGSIKSYGPAVIRVGCTSGLEIAVRSGQCDCALRSGNVTLHPREYLNLPTEASQVAVRPIPRPDNWDQFNSSRDESVYRQSQYVPANIGLVAGELSDYGGWRDDPHYGHVWCPRETAGWQPYREGNWVWSDPYGWTWVGRENWGWAPYHYGTWVHEGYGWAWCPGPARQCWSPAVVSFTNYGNNVAWCPLSPAEVRYPAAFQANFGIGGLFLSFSIGRAGCFYPVDGGYCEPRPWSNVFVNRVTNVYNIQRINNYYGQTGLGTAWGTHRFIPRNASFGGGVVVAAASFGRGGGFHQLAGNQSAVFARGKSFGMPGNGAGQISGPFNVRPVATSFNPSHAYEHQGPAAAVMNRNVYRAPVATFAGRNSVGLQRAMNPSSHTANIARAAGIGAGVVGGAVAVHAAANHFSHPGIVNHPAMTTRPGASLGHSVNGSGLRSPVGHPGSVGRATAVRPHINGVSSSGRRAAGSFTRTVPARSAAPHAGAVSRPTRVTHSFTRPSRVVRPAARPARSTPRSVIQRARPVYRPARTNSNPRPQIRPRQFSEQRPSRPAPVQRPQREASQPRQFRPAPPQRPSRPAPQERPSGGNRGGGGNHSEGGNHGGGHPANHGGDKRRP